MDVELLLAGGYGHFLLQVWGQVGISAVQGWPWHAGAGPAAKADGAGSWFTGDGAGKKALGARR